MAGLEEELVKDGSDGFPAKLFLDKCIVKDGPKKSDPPRRVPVMQEAMKAMAAADAVEKDARRKKAPAINKWKTDKAKHVAWKGKNRAIMYSKRPPVKKWRVVEAIDKTQTDKAAVEGEKTTSLIIGTKAQTDVQCAAESDPPAGATVKKNHMPPELVSHILGMPIDKPDDIVMPSFLKGNKDMAEALGVTEEWFEETYRDANLRVQRLHAKFLKYQVEIRDELFEKGYVEVDDDYFEQQAEIAEKERARWEEMEKKRDPTLTYKDYSEYNIPYDYEEQARRLVAL